MSEGAGKGDTPRPVDRKKYSKNYDRVFGNKKPWFDNDEHNKWLKEADKYKEKDNLQPKRTIS